MTATATASTWKSPSHGHSHSRSSRPTTTPRAHQPPSVGQAMPPQLSPHTRSPQTVKNVRSPDTGYFGFVNNDESIPPDSNPGNHVKQNWNFTSRGSASVAPKHQSNETNPEYEAFRRQSEQHQKFSLNGFASFKGESQPQSPITSSRPFDETSAIPPSKRPSQSRGDSLRKPATKVTNLDNSFFDLPRNESPGPMSPAQRSVADHQHARLSLPATELQAPLEALKKKQRSETVPPQVDTTAPVMVSAQEVAEILEADTDEVLVFDLRVYQQYATSRIQGALNLCLPTTLLKRPTFTVQKLAETFTSAHDKGEFEKWQDCEYIVVYDSGSMQAKEAIMPFNVLKKFASEGWTGRGLVVKGGYLTFAKQVPWLVDHGPAGQGSGSSTKPMSIMSPSENLVPVAGGCAMPETKSAANPFFGNIRQNMDLLDGVGQMPIKKPSGSSEGDERHLPKWLQEASSPADEGKKVSDKFLEIERSEQKRMQQALSAEVSYGAPHAEKTKQVQVAGIEKGSKNRYNNIFPYEHTRVKLQGVPSYGCDYVNASHVKATYSNRRYIATQAPTPATFEDFWRMVWEQDVKVIVMLTAESEGGQVKGHPYWNTGEYGQLKIKKLSEREVSLEKQKSKDKNPALTRPHLGSRRSTQPHTAGEKKVAGESRPALDAEAPVVMVRHFSLSHSAQPFKPMREVAQIHYSQWPDFGAPASPTAILGLIDQVNKYIRQSSSVAMRSESAAPPGERPVVVHCSAGCGRTGTYCTIDSVIDMLKRQKLERNGREDNDMEVDSPDDWITRDDIDLVARAVADFRQQRLSMVQNLRQFVLCYESIIQWIASQQHEDPRAKFMKEGPRRSYQGSLGS